MLNKITLFLLSIDKWGIFPGSWNKHKKYECAEI